MKNNEGQGLIWKNNEAQGLICDSMAFTCLLKFGSAAIFFLAIATLRLTADYCRAKKRDKVQKCTFILNSPGTACRANLIRRLVGSKLKERSPKLAKAKTEALATGGAMRFLYQKRRTQVNL
jgi:hypothetical protein